MRRKIRCAILSGMFLLLIGILLIGMYGGTEALLVCAYALAAVVILLTLAAGMFLYANRRFKNTNRYKNLFVGTDKYINSTTYRTNHTRNYDIANVGSSSAVFAFDYKDSAVKGCNWAMAPESLAYNFRVLKNYFSLLKKDGTLLITMTPFGFCLKDYSNDLANAKYYRYLDFRLILGYTRWKRYVLKKYPLLYSPVYALKGIVRDQPDDNRLALATNPMFSEELETDAIRWVENWKKQFSISDLDAPVSERNRENMVYNTNLLAEMISFSLERDLKPVIVLPPTTSALSSNFSDHFCETYIYSIIRNANTQGIPFLNYLRDDRFAKDELFFNSFFLNAEGRKVFTQGILSDLKLIKK